MPLREEKSVETEVPDAVLATSLKRDVIFSLPDGQNVMVAHLNNRALEAMLKKALLDMEIDSRTINTTDGTFVAVAGHYREFLEQQGFSVQVVYPDERSHAKLVRAIDTPLQTRQMG